MKPTMFNDKCRPKEVDPLHKRQYQRKVHDFTRVGDYPEINKNKNSENGKREIKVNSTEDALDQITRNNKKKGSDFKKALQKIKYEKPQDKCEKLSRGKFQKDAIRTLQEIKIEDLC